ncbi:methyl-accepting chemotaxis protein [Paraburkholderia sp. GAS199]|uniref:methyl-accepting chemotaxis protein n=1 Tax=Paraburkholderia sp. GAS199 TaxID=3035126 RepID=UPI003D1CC522
MESVPSFSRAILDRSDGPDSVEPTIFLPDPEFVATPIASARKERMRAVCREDFEMLERLSTPNSRTTELSAIARTGDLVLLAALCMSAILAISIGSYYGEPLLAFIVSVPVLAAGAVAFALARGSLLTRVLLTVCNVVLVALHIQLSRGTVEFHFGVFVLLGLLLVYQDWRVLVLAATLFVLHHFLFDRLQAFNFAVYCTATPDLWKMMLHAGYVAGQTGIEIYLAVCLRRGATEAADLLKIVRAIDHDGHICLDVADVQVSAPTAHLLKAALQKMQTGMREVSAAAASIENAASEIALGNLYLSQRTEEQASSLQTTSVSMERLTGSVKDTARTAGEVADLSSAASAAAFAGGEAVGRVVATMQEISQSSERISDISSVVDSIAFQTNILALNAAVEAARAGEQGRGFAVVATEVRSLAQRSASAAREIKGLIGDSTGRVGLGVEIVDEAGDRIENVVRQARLVSELIGTISHSSGEQTTGITQISAAVMQLEAVTQQNAALVEQSAAATESLRSQAARLNAVVGTFQL